MIDDISPFVNSITGTIWHESTPPPLILRSELVDELQAILSASLSNDEARTRLGALLQTALTLEFATVPPYLSAAYSLKRENQEISHLIVRSAKEEMLHMTVVANLMNAIGISPDIVAATPSYPYDLDMLANPIRLDLKSFSLDLVEKVFMQIETPEEPVDFSTAGLRAKPTTIGLFYNQIIDIIRDDLIPDLFANAEHNVYKQIEVDPNFTSIKYLSNSDSGEYPLASDFNFIIRDKTSAIRHLEWVVDQGEGAAELDPLTAEGIPGHYYRFESILEGKYLIKDVTAEKGFWFSGGDLPFVKTAAYQFVDNAKAQDFSGHEFVCEEMSYFNEQYTRMVDLLQSAFNCPDPAQVPSKDQDYKESIRIMRGLTNIARVIAETAEEDGVIAGIPFEYETSSPSIS